MLNRLFIAIGLLTILVIMAAFLVPRLIPWGNYRDRMEQAATAALGAPVSIEGDIAFQLLPQPLLTFNKVTVGPPEAPAMTVAHLEAELSLLDFLRDRYSITRLLLQEPELLMAIGPDGALAGPLMGGSTGLAGNVTIEDASISAGTIKIADARASDTLRIDGLQGAVELPGQGAPFAFQGSGILGDSVYDLRLTSTVPVEGKSRLALFVQRADARTSISAEGELTLADRPGFRGDLTLRSRPPASNTDMVRGDLVITSSVEAGLDRVVLPAYTLLPDENRAGTRLTGAARLVLGPDPKFDAVVSGGVLALPPRDATTEDAVVPYELVRLLAELPAPPLVSLPGTIGVDIAEVNLRALALRNVRFDALSGPQGWTLKNFAAVLPGNTRLKLDGTLTAAGERPHFSGTASLETSRLDALAQLWRRPSARNVLFNQKAAFSSGVTLDDETLSLGGGKLVLAGASHDIAVSIGFGQSRRLDVAAAVGDLDPDASEIVAALLPDLSASGGFGVTFPRGSIAAKANSATVLGLPGAGLNLEGSWEGGVLDLKSLSAADLGGAQFALAATVFGTMARPELFGDGTVRVASADAPALGRLFDLLETPEPLREALVRSAPVDLALRLDAPGGDGGQVMAVAGRAGVGDLTAQAQLAGGLFRAAHEPMGLKLDLVSADVAGLSSQLGLGDVSLLSPDGPMKLSLTLSGAPAGSLETSVALESGADSLGFAGNIATADPERWTGNGVLKANLAEPGAIAEQLGAGGITLPPISGSAQLGFAGLDHIELNGIKAQSGGQPVEGELTLVRQGGAGAVNGVIALGSVPLEGLTAAIVGPAGLISSGGGDIWPDGPISIGDAPRQTTGRVEIESASITARGAPALSDVRFDLAWDSDSLRVGDLAGTLGGGQLTFDAKLCCAGTVPDKTLTARVGLDGVSLPALLPTAAGSWLKGTLSGAAQVEGTGDSLLAAISSLAGEGSFAVRNFEVQGFAGSAFAAAASLEKVGDVPPDVLAGQIEQALEEGPFTAPEVAGSFTVAAGALRNANLAVEGKDVRLFGGGSVRLADLALDGAYSLTPTKALGDGGHINETTSQVTARLGGTLLAPQRKFEVNGLVDAIQVHAYEVELAELERLRAEDEARMKAAAEERARRLAAEKAVKDAETAKASVDAALAAVAQGQKAVLAAADATGDTAEAAAVRQAESIAAAQAAAQEAAAARRRASQPAPAVSTPAPAVQQPLVLTPTEPATRF